MSGVKGNISVVENGALAGKQLDELIKEYKEKLVGQKVYQQHGEDFPLLVKFIDANEDLSIQVHPDDALAQSRHQSLGKTEMWYIIQADKGAKLISGFNRDVNKDIYLQYLQEQKLGKVLNEEEARADDVFFIPAGRVHTIGKGLLLAEIQQSSDITYRIHDYDRKDTQGNKRELHTEAALDAIDYKHYKQYKTQYTPQKNQAVELVKSHYFTTNLLNIDLPLKRNYDALDSFIIFVCLHGEATLDYTGGKMVLKTGDCILLPASLKNICLEPLGEFKALESYVTGESRVRD
jgi:mannose-6-phosphate isomerase